MLPKKHRLQKDADFQKIWKNGKSFYTKNLGFKILKTNSEISRFGIVVSIKTAKTAVARNQIRRRLAEILRLLLPKIAEGYDLILSVLPGAVSLNYHELQKDVVAGLNHFNLLVS